jgi:hypothetical protein
MQLSRRGDSLIELIVALLILELVGGAALATALVAERLTRHATNGARDDDARLAEYRARETDSACVARALPDTGVLDLPATADRPALHLVWRCGR